MSKSASLLKAYKKTIKEEYQLYIEHFGVKLYPDKMKYSLKINKDEFALINTHPSLPMFDSLVEKGAYTDQTGKEYTVQWCEDYRKLCLENYDLNMSFFSILNEDDFKTEVEWFLMRHPNFEEVDDLNVYQFSSGYYLMVLDGYKQAYIGQSTDIYKRIRQHWSTTKPFDRVLFPMYAVKKSCFSIDFFRALDTTRIYVWETELDFKEESILINDFPQPYLTNRI